MLHHGHAGPQARAQQFQQTAVGVAFGREGGRGLRPQVQGTWSRASANKGQEATTTLGRSCPDPESDIPLKCEIFHYTQQM